jgi:predicted alpha/beta-hydrolase family hydrolase
MRERVSSLDTTRGPARLTSLAPVRPAAVALLMHGAGGDSSATVLVRVTERLVAAGVAVVRLDQPYRVAGRRAPDPAARLDEVALEVLARLRRRWPAQPLLLGGKSSGARVACRVSGAARAAGVVALGFPLHPPGRPERSRADELLGAACPVLVTQGTRDTFGTPDDLRAVLPPSQSQHARRMHAVSEHATRMPTGGRAAVTVHAVEGGDHSFAARKVDGRTTAECLAEVADVVAMWAVELLRQAT